MVSESPSSAVPRPSLPPPSPRPSPLPPCHASHGEKELMEEEVGGRVGDGMGSACVEAWVGDEDGAGSACVRDGGGPG